MAPLTEEEKQQVANKLFKNFRYKGHLLLPDDEFYGSAYDQKSIEISAKKIFVWFGIKPRSVDYRISNQVNGYSKDSGSYVIQLSKNTAKNQFISTAIISRACIEYILEKNKIQRSPEIIEFMILEFGLGLLVMNAVNSGNELQAKLNRFIRLTSPVISKDVLSQNSAEEFFKKLMMFISANEIDKRELSEYILPWALPKNIQSIGMLKRPLYVNTAYNTQTNIRKKALLLSITAIGLLVFCSYVLAIQPKKLSPELQAQKDTIAILSHSYTTCLNSYRQKEKQLDPNDIFVERQLNAHLSRCKSLQNKHDYMVADFNRAILEF